jgi:pyruvate kinase
MVRAPGSRATPPAPRGVEGLVRRLEALRRHLADVEARVPLGTFGRTRASARNLLHYVELRRFDLRHLQTELADLGLSSLGRSEGHVLANLDAVRARLYATIGRAPPAAAGPPGIGPEDGRRRIAVNAARLFGPARAGRATRIMVTLPAEAADDPTLVRELVNSGMDCVRINCAHDSPVEWGRMIRHVRRAAERARRRCPILMDLGGPRLRTAPLPPRAAVLKLRPERGPTGRPRRPALLAFVAADSLGPPAHAPEGPPEIPVPRDWLARRRVGEVLRITDARGARRALTVRSRGPGRVVVALRKTAYLTNGLSVGAVHRTGGPDVATLRGIPAVPGRIGLVRGDRLRLVAGDAPRLGRAGARALASIGVTLPEVLAHVRPGHRVWFDGGRIGGIVRSVAHGGAVVRIDRTPPGGAWLRGDQGINLPDTDLGLPPLTPEDRHDLGFVAERADLVGYSFVQTGGDVGLLREELARLGRPRMGIVLKVETRRAFDELPGILFSALRHGPAGVMIARGDLAVEVGFERLAEVQEEVLWLCEAAHLPAIWATQVLEEFAKSGMPSRAEVTDAAMGERAECVMLNKGPYLVTAVRALDSILRRMQAHQAKKTARLRQLAVAERFLASVVEPPAGRTSTGPPRPVPERGRAEPGDDGPAVRGRRRRSTSPSASARSGRSRSSPRC